MMHWWQSIYAKAMRAAMPPTRAKAGLLLLAAPVNVATGAGAAEDGA